MKYYKWLLYIILAATTASCSFLSLLDDPDEASSNPFNGVRPASELDNSIGFYASAIQYRQPQRYLWEDPNMTTLCHVREPVDSMLIYSELTAYYVPDWKYSAEDKTYYWNNSKEKDIFKSTVKQLLPWGTENQVIIPYSCIDINNNVTMEDVMVFIYRTIPPNVIA